MELRYFPSEVAKKRNNDAKAELSGESSILSVPTLPSTVLQSRNSENTHFYANCLRVYVDSFKSSIRILHEIWI